LLQLRKIGCEGAANVFVDDAGDEGLVGDAFVGGFHLDTDEVLFGHTDTDSLILFD